MIKITKSLMEARTPKIDEEQDIMTKVLDFIFPNYKKKIKQRKIIEYIMNENKFI